MSFINELFFLEINIYYFEKYEIFIDVSFNCYYVCFWMWNDMYIYYWILYYLYFGNFMIEIRLNCFRLGFGFLFGKMWLVKDKIVLNLWI